MVSEVQSIIFKKSLWSKARAIAWLKKHGFKYDVDNTSESYRFRQRSPRKFKRFITKEEGDISFIIGFK